MVRETKNGGEREDELHKNCLCQENILRQLVCVITLNQRLMIGGCKYVDKEL